jgi:hypothetical protein
VVSISHNSGLFSLSRRNEIQTHRHLAASERREASKAGASRLFASRTTTPPDLSPGALEHVAAELAACRSVLVQVTPPVHGGLGPVRFGPRCPVAARTQCQNLAAGKREASERVSRFPRSWGLGRRSTAGLQFAQFGQHFSDAARSNTRGATGGKGSGGPTGGAWSPAFRVPPQTDPLPAAVQSM